MNFKLNKRSRFAGFAALAAMIIFSPSCKKKENNGPNGPSGNNQATELSCDFFHEDRVLVDDPEAPVDYIISCEAQVKGKLTVEPGVVIAFKENASLFFQISSSIKMEGTQSKPIVLTGETPEKGLWRGVAIESTKPSNSMKYVTIEYAGSVSTSHSGGMYPAGLQVIGNGDVSMDHCTIQHCKDNGLYWTSSKYISITNSTFTNNDVPVKTWSSNPMKIINNTNSYTGNVKDYVHLKHPSVNDEGNTITWEKIDVPYYVTTGGYNRFDIDNAHLIIEPGVDMIMATAGTHMRIRPDGSMKAVGTANDPIIIRGENDVPAAWGFIFFQSGSAMNEIGHAEIKNAGGSMSNVQAATQIHYDSYLNIHDVNFTNNAGYAVGMLYTAAMPWPVVTWENLTTDNNKLFCKGTNGPELQDPNDPN